MRIECIMIFSSVANWATWSLMRSYGRCSCVQAANDIFENLLMLKTNPQATVEIPKVTPQNSDTVSPDFLH